MTALKLLQTKGPMQARAIARAMGMHVDLVYAELVPLESCGMVRVNVIHKDRDKEPVRLWEAMTEVGA